MGKDASKLEKEIESLRKRIQTSKRKLHEAERKAADLQEQFDIFKSGNEEALRELGLA